jgi:hypothetical protein
MSNQPKNRDHQTDKRASPPTGPQQNEGEGNRTAARSFNADEQRFASDPKKVDKAAQAAKQALVGPEAKDLSDAEKAGRKHAKG